MIVNEKDKYLIDYYPIDKSKSEEEAQTANKICEKILNNFQDHPKDMNYLYDLNIWDEYKDNILSQLVMFYNFDFNQISKVFDKLCKIKRKLDENGDEIPVYTEKILRYHWSFIHARRFFGKKTDEEFYILNHDDKTISDKIDKKEKEIKDITKDKSIVNTVDIYSLNKENNLNDYFDKLFSQKIDKDRTKVLEMEISEKKNKINSFPINIRNNSEDKNVDKIIDETKKKELEKAKEIEKQKMKAEQEEQDF